MSSLVGTWQCPVFEDNASPITIYACHILDDETGPQLPKQAAHRPNEPNTHDVVDVPRQLEELKNSEIEGDEGEGADQ